MKDERQRELTRLLTGRLGAVCLWQQPQGEPRASMLEAWAKNGRMFLVQRFEGFDGWGVYIPAEETNNTEATFAAVERYTQGLPPATVADQFNARAFRAFELGSMNADDLNEIDRGPLNDEPLQNAETIRAAILAHEFPEPAAQLSAAVAMQAQRDAFIKAAQRVAGLNEKAGTIGPGMLLTIVTEARAALQAAAILEPAEIAKGCEK